MSLRIESSVERRIAMLDAEVGKKHRDASHFDLDVFL
jgi:hypothetical protein